MSRISQDGLEFIKREECNKDAEGKVICSLQAYAATPDEVKKNIYTIAYGNTHYLDGSPVKKGDTITQVNADKLYAGIIAKFEGELEPLLKGINLNQHQYDALMSFAYNIGMKQFANSTLLKQLRLNNYQVVSNEFLKWEFQNGKKLSNLVDRRIKERALFNKDT